MTFIFGSWRSYDGCSAMTHRTLWMFCVDSSWFALMNGKPLRWYSLSMTWTNEPLWTSWFWYVLMVWLCVCDPWLGACPEFDAKSWTDADQHGRTGWKAIWRKRCRWCSGYVRCFYADDLCVQKSEAAQYEPKIYQWFDLFRSFRGISIFVALPCDWFLLSIGGGNLSSWLDSWWIQWHRSHGCLVDHYQVWTWEHQLTKLSS